MKKLYRIVAELGSNQGYHEAQGEELIYCGYDRDEARRLYHTSRSSDHDRGPGSQYRATKAQSLVCAD